MGYPERPRRLQFRRRFWSLALSLCDWYLDRESCLLNSMTKFHVDFQQDNRINNKDADAFSHSVICTHQSKTDLSAVTPEQRQHTPPQVNDWSSSAFFCGPILLIQKKNWNTFSAHRTSWIGFDTERYWADTSVSITSLIPTIQHVYVGFQRVISKGLITWTDIP